MRTSKIIALVVGSLLALGSLGLIGGGAAMIWAHNTQRDADGFYTTDTHPFETETYAITTDRIDLGGDTGGPTWNPISAIGTARLVVEGSGGRDVFLGIAPADQVDAYLSGVEHVTYDGADLDPFRPRYRLVEGDATPTDPGELDIWVAQVSGIGEQTLTWEVAAGSYQIVIMGSDAEPGVAVEASAGLATGWLGPIGAGLLGLGLLVAALSLSLLLIGSSSDDTTASEAAAGLRVPVGPPPEGRMHPVWLHGRLDPDLSRWLWLVKWLLALPHVVALAVLGVAAVVLSIVAGIVILFTGRYPRGIFTFVLGVMRWTWRVTFYAFVLGTDRYPPFSLQDVPDYPARLDIPVPEHLSQPLVLVKWWLLVLPHYLVIAVFGGGWTLGIGGDLDGGRLLIGGGLIGLLAVIAGVGLLFTGRYPQGLFDLIMGMERWTYRVLGYAGLMTDDYPPFRLDAGGEEPVRVERRREPR